MSELNGEIVNRLAKEAGMTRAVGPKRNAWHGWEHELEEFANLVAKHVRNTERSAWVIEGAWSSTAAPDYWVGSSAWTTDHMKALRFARRDDAKQAADMMLDGVYVRICEHVWGLADQPSAAPASASPTIPEANDRADDSPMDAGPWHVLGDKVNGDLIGVGSDDFTRDVLLRVDGDFKCEMEKADYCAWLARTLNLNTGHSHCPHCGQWHDLKLGC